MTIDGLLNNAKTLQMGLQSGAVMRSVLEPHGAEIVEQQRIQLLEGKASSGEDLHPFYSEDIKPKGWFTTRQKAANYAAWKQSLSYPYSVKRNPDAPNLYITGLFHDDIGIEFGSEAVMIKPDTAYAANIMGKYGLNVFGLNWEHWTVIFDEKGAKDELIERTKEILMQ